MQKLGLLLLSGVLMVDICRTTGTDCNTVADIVILVDSSGSVGQEHFTRQLQFLTKLTAGLPVSQDSVQIGLVTFSTHPRLEFNLNEHLDESELTQAILGTNYVDGGTHTDEALKYVRENSFRSTSGHRAGVTKVVLVLTDGKSNDPSRTAREAQALRDSLVEVYTIGIGRNIPRTELATIASGPEYIIMVNSFDDLETIKSRVTQAFCQPSGPCLDSPCQNGASCKNIPNGYTCSCPRNYFGQNCEIDLCADVAPDCAARFGVCRDPVAKVTLCRKTCAVCGDSEIKFPIHNATTPPPMSVTTPCVDTIPNCTELFGVCRNDTMATTSCRHTCARCGSAKVLFGR